MRRAFIGKKRRAAALRWLAKVYACSCGRMVVPVKEDTKACIVELLKEAPSWECQRLEALTRGGRES